MSDIVPMTTQVPAHLQGRLGKPSALSESLAGGLQGGPEYPRISIKGSRFRIVEDGVETVLPTTALDVIVVGANPKLSKTFYAKQWTPDSENTAPDCFSLDGVRPHPDSGTPQNDLCASCPNNAWGSATTPDGKDAKKCADQKRLAVLAADDPSGPLYLLQVTPAALKGLNAYHKQLMQHGIAAEVARTRVSFDSNASFPKLTFAFAGFLDEAAQNEVDKRIGTDEALVITGEKLVATPTASGAQALGQTELPQAATTAPEPAAQPTQEPAAQAETPKAHGFTANVNATPEPAAQPAQEPATQTAAPKEEPTAPTTSAEGASLASEIANMLNGAADDA